MRFWLFFVLGVILTIGVVTGNYYLLSGEVQATLDLGLMLFGLVSVLFAAFGGCPEAFRPFGDMRGGMWFGSTMTLLCASVLLLG